MTRLFHKKIWVLILTISMVSLSGCDILEFAVSDIGGWDVSACVDGFSTCFELFRDNAEKFDDGFPEALGGL